MIRLTLITRHDCHLCDDMTSVVGQVAPAFRAEVETLDVDTDPGLHAQYGDQVPVLLIDGRKAFKYRVTAAALARRLRAARRRRLLGAWRRRLIGRRST